MAHFRVYPLGALRGDVPGLPIAALTPPCNATVSPLHLQWCDSSRLSLSDFHHLIQIDTRFRFLTLLRFCVTSPLAYSGGETKSRCV
jgi:hypothetical protein